MLCGPDVGAASLLGTNHAEDPGWDEGDAGDQVVGELLFHDIAGLFRLRRGLLRETAEGHVARQDDRAAADEGVESSVGPDQRVLVVLLGVEERIPERPFIRRWVLQ